MITNNMRSGGQMLVDQLILLGATSVFCVPGESYLPAFGVKLVDSAALYTALTEGWMALAGLDDAQEEPAKLEN